MAGQEDPMNSCRLALKALRQEILDFRFAYPLDVVSQAGPKESLYYYLYSDKLSWSVMSMDSTGVPRARRRLYGEVYKAAYIAWWGLVNLGHALRNNDSAGREVFLRQVAWLESHAVVWPDGTVVWPNHYDLLEGDTLLVAPWVSAYDQGMVISALVRGYRLTRRTRLLELLHGAHRVFEINTGDGGVREVAPHGVVYVEIPGGRPPGILDGFLTSLLGLYDLFVETGDASVEGLFREGIIGLKSFLPTWDYRHKWSWYATRKYLSPPAYHNQNRYLLSVVARLADEPDLAEQAERWNPDTLSAMSRLEIYLGFQLTKNWSRVRHRTWRQNQAQIQRAVRTRRA
jgi:heparosan-N-sulfate-glucuronate 5-epimerase